MTDEEKKQNIGDKFRKAQTLVVEILNLNPQDEDAAKVFKLWKKTGHLFGYAGGKY